MASLSQKSFTVIFFSHTIFLTLSIFFLFSLSLNLCYQIRPRLSMLLISVAFRAYSGGCSGFVKRGTKKISRPPHRFRTRNVALITPLLIIHILQNDFYNYETRLQIKQKNITRKSQRNNKIIVQVGL